MNAIKIAVDVDGVVVNFDQSIIDIAKSKGLGHEWPESWKHVDRWFDKDKLLKLVGNAWYKPEFWLSLRPFTIDEARLDFTPACYITARPVTNCVTAYWLAKGNFPYAPVFSVDEPEEKLMVVQAFKTDVLIDDRIETIEYFLEKGYKAILYTSPHQSSRDTTHLPTVSRLQYAEIERVYKTI